MSQFQVDAAGLETLDLAPHESHDAEPFRKIIAAIGEVESATRGLRTAVEHARASGLSWTVIGAALGTSRQNAQQRFGHHGAVSAVTPRA